MVHLKLHMSEYDSTWPGWEFALDRAELVETMCNPTGGIALIRTTSKPRALVEAIGIAGQTLPEVAASNHILYMHYDSPGSSDDGYLPRDLAMGEKFPDQASALEDLRAELQGVFDEVRAGMNSEQTSVRLGLNFALRHRHKGHVDPADVRAWCGADQPGFFVVRRGEKIFLPSLPENHVLLMRGGEVPPLEGIRHGAVYRSSKVWRAILLAQ